MLFYDLATFTLLMISDISSLNLIQLLELKYWIEDVDSNQR